MIDPDVLRQLAADLEAKVDVFALDMDRMEDQGDDSTACYYGGKADAYADMAERIRAILADGETEQRESTDSARRDGYDQAVATLRDVADRTGSRAARWAADYLVADPDRRAPGAQQRSTEEPA